MSKSSKELNICSCSHIKHPRFGEKKKIPTSNQNYTFKVNVLWNIILKYTDFNYDLV